MISIDMNQCGCCKRWFGSINEIANHGERCLGVPYYIEMRMSQTEKERLYRNGRV